MNTTIIDYRDLINDHLKKNDRNYKWLEKHTKIPYGSIYSTLAQKVMHFDANRMKLINNLLGTDFK
jgi:hypothetical protein